MILNENYFGARILKGELVLRIFVETFQKCPVDNMYSFEIMRNIIDAER